MDVKNAKKLYHLLQILKGNHSFEETALIRDAFDEMYLLMHNSPELFEQLSEEEILSICTHDMKETADKFIKEQLSPGIVASFKVNDDITVYLCRGVTNLKNETVKKQSDNRNITIILHDLISFVPSAIPAIL